MSNIKLENVTIKFQNKKDTAIITAVDHLSCLFSHGEVSVILGASGCGKTTILNAILGNVLINGSIYINDQDIKNMSIKEKNVSYVSQEFALYPHMTVFENIAFPLQLLKVDREEKKTRVEAVAKDLGILDLLSRLPRELSIGQRQRVALARALIKKSDIYLFDEPFSNVDKKISEEIKVLLKAFLKKNDSTAIFVSHETSDAFLLADQVFVLEDGKLLFNGTPKDILDNKNPAIEPYFKIENLDELVK